MPKSKNKYVTTSEMIRGVQLPDTPDFRAGDFRVFRPTRYDVLCGRGAPIQNHEGNVRMRRIISKFARRYFNARKFIKQSIADEAVLCVKGTGSVKARFLKRADRENFWYEVDDKVASDKVSHFLRCMVRKGDLDSLSESPDEEAIVDAYSGQARAALSTDKVSARTDALAGFGAPSYPKLSKHVINPITDGVSLPMMANNLLLSSRLAESQSRSAVLAANGAGLLPNFVGSELEQRRLALQQHTSNKVIYLANATNEVINFVTKERLRRQVLGLNQAPLAQSNLLGKNLCLMNDDILKELLVKNR